MDTFLDRKEEGKHCGANRAIGDRGTYRIGRCTQGDLRSLRWFAAISVICRATQQHMETTGKATTEGATALRPVEFDYKAIESERRRMVNPLLFRTGLLLKLPLAFPTGMKVTRIDDRGATATVPFRFINKNPFKTMYWAVLGMVAEMVSGVILLNYASNCKPSVATFVIGCDAKFLNRSLGLTTFECNDGPLIKSMVEKAAATGQAHTFKTSTNGVAEDGTVVAEFIFTWSVKGRRA